MRYIDRVVKDLPNPDFVFEWMPSAITLFRFSALTFNGHYIHLDRDYATKSEGYPGEYIYSLHLASYNVTGFRETCPRALDCPYVTGNHCVLLAKCSLQGV